MASDMFAVGKTLERALVAMGGLDAATAGLAVLTELAARLTLPEPSERPTAAQALQHAYFTTAAAETEARLLSAAQQRAAAAEEERRELVRETVAVDARKSALEQQARALAAREEETAERIRRQRQAVDGGAARNEQRERELQAEQADLEGKRRALHGDRVGVEQQRAELQRQHAAMERQRGAVREQLVELGQRQQCEWQNEHGAWVAYPSEQNARIHEARIDEATETFEFLLEATGQTYAIAFAESVQRNTHTGIERPIRFTWAAPAGGIPPLEGERGYIERNERHTYELQCGRRHDAADPRELRFRIAESQFIRLAGAQARHVTQVDYVVNSTLLRAFEAKQAEFAARYGAEHAKPILAFHGTRGADAVRSIMRDNFDVARLAQGHGDNGKACAPTAVLLVRRFAHSLS